LLGGDKNSKNPRQYLASVNNWIPGRIPRLREQLAGVEKKFKEHSLSQLKMGNTKPREWPEHCSNKRTD